MDFRLPFVPDDTLVPRPRGPVRIWMLVSLIGVVLGGAVVAAGVATDERDFAHRHASIPRASAL